MYTIVYGREGETFLKYSLEIMARISRLRLRLDFITSYEKINIFSSFLMLISLS